MTPLPPLRATLLLALALLAPAALAGAGELYSGFEDATGYHTQKKMARAEDGTLYLTYVVPAAGDGDATDVVVRRGDHELPRVQGARGDLSRPSLALAADGTLFLAWTERADEDREVFAARWLDGRWHDITQLSGGDGYAGFPSLGAGADGRVHVAWYGFDGDFYQTFYREWSEGAWQPATQLSSGPLDANNPSLVVDEEGAVHVAWYKDEGRRYSLWYARRAPDGAWELPRRLPQGDGDALNAALAVDLAQRVHLVWDERTPEATRVMHALLGESPQALGEGEYAAIAAAPRAEGGWLVAWAAPDGTIMGADGGGTRALLGGAAQGRHPSLRGPGPVERDGIVDLLWARPDEGGREIVHRALHEGCSPWAPACETPASSTPPPRAATPSSGLALLALAWSLALLRRPGHNH